MSDRGDLSYYKTLNYRVELFFDPEERVWYAEFPELEGCLAHGSTKEEALANAEKAKNAWLEVAFETGRQVPEPRPEIEYSGRLLVRMPRSLHEWIAREARREGTSLNRWIIQALSEEKGRREAISVGTDEIRAAFRATISHAVSTAYGQFRTAERIVWLAAEDEPIRDVELSVHPVQVGPTIGRQRIGLLDRGLTGKGWHGHLLGSSRVIEEGE